MLYLVQHGEAVTKDQDPERPLSEQGASDCRRLGHFLSRVEVTVDGLFHSGKLRARQSAEILGSYLAAQEAPQVLEGLQADSPAEPMATEMGGWQGDYLVVSHLPFLGKLVAVLVTGQEAPAPVAFQPGTVVALEASDETGWPIAWMLRPELLR